MNTEMTEYMHPDTKAIEEMGDWDAMLRRKEYHDYEKKNCRQIIETLEGRLKKETNSFGYISQEKLHIEKELKIWYAHRKVIYDDDTIYPIKHPKGTIYLN